MSGDGAYDHWTIERAALDAALSNAAQEALRGINRGGPRRLERIARTYPPQFVAIGTIDQIAALLAQQPQMRARFARQEPERP